jgi:UDP-glucose 4-epimerase
MDYFLVTGGAGFIGSHLIPFLVNKYPKTRIVSVDNYFTGKKENHINSKNVTYLKGNTINIFEIWKKYKFPRPKAIFHLGEYSRVTQSFGDFDIVWNFNMVGTKEVVKFASEVKAKLVYAGSSSIFGNGRRDENLTPYAWIKAKNIELIKNYSVWFGLDYIITYFYNVYGPGQIRDGKYATVVGIFEDQYQKGEPLTVVSPGTDTRDFTHVEDIVKGIILCYEKGNGDGYQLGTGKETSIIDLAKMFKTKYVFIPKRKGERKRGKANYSKAANLGWRAEINLKDYVDNFIKTS